MTRFWIDCFPWDIEAEGFDAAVSRIKGDLGADDLRVQVQSDDIVQWRGRDFGGSRLVNIPAGAHFRPASNRYENTRIRPVASAWMKSRDPFARIASACESIGLGLTVRASCLRNRALVEKYPMAACVNAFGDASGNRLCPANADVRAYAVALATDLAELAGVHRVELSDVCYQSSAYAVAAPLGVEFGYELRGLLAWCFCPTCRQRSADSGFDAEMAMASLRTLIDRCAASGKTAVGEVHRALESDASLRGYAATQIKSERDLVAALAAKLGDQLTVAVNDDCELALIAGLENLHVAVRRRARPQSTETDIAPRTVQSRGGESRVGVRFDAYPPFEESVAALVADVHAAVDAGHKEIGFYADGLWPPNWLDGVRQAIRYARRER